MAPYIEESNISETEEVATQTEAPPKIKKPRSEKQIAAFKKARETLDKNRALKKVGPKVTLEPTNSKSKESTPVEKDEEVEPPIWFRKFVQQTISQKKYKKSPKILTVEPGSHYGTGGENHYTTAEVKPPTPPKESYEQPVYQPPSKPYTPQFANYAPPPPKRPHYSKIFPSRK